MEIALLFDIDGTLTDPRRPLEREMAVALKGLTVPFHVAAGSDLSLVQPQLLDPLREFGFQGSFEAFLSNGAAHFRCDYSNEASILKVNEFNFRDHFGREDHAYLLCTIEDVLSDEAFRLPPPLEVIGEQLVDRISMLNVAPIGRPRGQINREAQKNREAFCRFDEETGYRQQMLEALKERLSRLRTEKGLLIMLGGETSFDLVISGMDKRNAVRTLLAEGYHRLVFLGDSLFEGGNDSVISEFIAAWEGEGACPLEAIQVQGWRDTISVLSRRNWLPQP